MEKKKLKLNIDELKVQSFVTSFDLKNGETLDLRGGATQPADGCSSLWCSQAIPNGCSNDGQQTYTLSACCIKASAPNKSDSLIKFDA